MSSKTGIRTSRAHVNRAEGHTTMETPSARYAEPVLDDAVELSEGEGRHIAPNNRRPNSDNKMDARSGENNTEIIETTFADDIIESGEELFENPIDTSVHAAVVDSGMSESQRLQVELEGIEARIAEISKDELSACERLTEAQRATDDLRTARVTLEEAANVIRQRLGRPSVSIVVRLATGQPKPTVVRRRRIQQGTRIDQFLAVLERLMIGNGGSATRQVIKHTWLEAGLFEGMENIDSTLDGYLNRFKSGGYITTEYRGSWKWTGIRETKTVGP